MARQLTNRQAKRSRKSKGFTLIELMVVTAIAGVLGSVAVPKFLGARDIADAKAQVAAAVGIGKECQTWVQTRGEGMAQKPASTGGVTVVCDENTGGTVTSKAFAALPENFTGISCIGTSSAGKETGATITIESTGEATCAFTGAPTVS